jgi:hypothetical protein
LNRECEFSEQGELPEGYELAHRVRAGNGRLGHGDVLLDGPGAGSDRAYDDGADRDRNPPPKMTTLPTLLSSTPNTDWPVPASRASSLVERSKYIKA